MNKIKSIYFVGLMIGCILAPNASAQVAEGCSIPSNAKEVHAAALKKDRYVTIAYIKVDGKIREKKVAQTKTAYYNKGVPIPQFGDIKFIFNESFKKIRTSDDRLTIICGY